MRILNIVVCAALCAAVQGFGPGAARADEGDGVLAAHPMPVYPGSVEEKSGGRLARLTRDDLAAVRKFFEARLQPGDRIEPYSAAGETGFTVVYAKKLGKREQTAFELRAVARTEKSPPHQAFGELNAQVSMGRHSESELRALEKQYGDIDLAYFRAASGEGRARDEAGVLLEAAHKAAHPDADKLKAAGRRNKVSAGDKAEAKELQKKMKELKAQGDMAGMMALAQSGRKFQSPPAGMTEAAAMAAEDRNRDTWDLWVKCLKDTRDAAYRTRLEYSAEALKD